MTFMADASLRSIFPNIFPGLGYLGSQLSDALLFSQLLFSGNSTDIFKQYLMPVRL